MGASASLTRYALDKVAEENGDVERRPRSSSSSSSSSASSSSSHLAPSASPPSDGQSAFSPRASKSRSTRSKSERRSHDPKWCAHVKNYVENQYGSEVRSNLATAGGSDDKQADNFVALARNYLRFWLETTDLEQCSESAFRQLRTDDICERYFRVGGKFKLPFNKLVVEEVLIARDNESVLAKDVFMKARSEAMEYLEAEVLPFFYISPSKLGYRAVKHALHAPQAPLSSTGDRKSAFLASTNNSTNLGSTGGAEGGGEEKTSDPSQVLREWMEDDPNNGFDLRAYLSASNQPELVAYLDFYLESFDFRAIYAGERASDDSDDQDIDDDDMAEDSTILLHFNDLFDKYILLGTDLRSQVPEDLVAELLDAACDGDGDLDVSILDSVRVFATGSLLKAWDKYKREREGDIHGMTLRALETEAWEGVQDVTQDKLAQLLQTESSFCTSFQRYLTANEPLVNSHVLELYLAARGFEVAVNKAKQGHMEDMVITQSKATKIFEEFLRPGAPKETNVIPGRLRRKVQRSLKCPHATMFAECQDLALRALAAGPAGRYSAHNKAAGNRFSPRSPSSKDLLPPESPAPGNMLREVPLSVILQRHEWCRAFKKYAEGECLLVPVVFWHETADFLRLPRADLMLSRSRKIIRMYILDGAPRYFKLSHEVVDNIHRNSSIPGPAMFVDAQKVAFMFMDQHMMPRFRETAFYKMIRMSFMVDDLEGATLGSPISNNSHATDNELTSSPMGIDDDNHDRQSVPLDLLKPGSPTGMSLKKCLQSSLATRFFKDYCIARQHGETVLFWIEANDFKAHVPGKQFMALQARKIAKKYIEDGAKMKVNIRADTQHTIMANIGTPKKDLFQEAQDECFKILQAELYPLFIVSPQYEEMAELARYETIWTTIKRRVTEVFDGQRRSSYSNRSAGGRASVSMLAHAGIRSSY